MKRRGKWGRYGRRKMSYRAVQRRKMRRTLGFKR